MIALPRLVGYCVFPFMPGALLSLVAFVLSGLPPAAAVASHGAGPVTSPSVGITSAAAAEDSACGWAGPACEDPESSEAVIAPLVDGVSENHLRHARFPGQTREVATPAQIGCALVFRNTSAVDHTTALHVRASSPVDVRLWSCDESALRVFNAWYRVSRYPESESPRGLSLRASGPIAFAAGAGGVASVAEGHPSHQASGPQADQVLCLSPRPGFRPPSPDNFSLCEANLLLVKRPLVPPDRPPRAAVV